MDPDLAAMIRAIDLAFREVTQAVGRFAQAAGRLLPEWDLSAWIAAESELPEASTFVGGHPLIFADWLEERGRPDLAERLRRAHARGKASSPAEE